MPTLGIHFKLTLMGSWYEKGYLFAVEFPETVSTLYLKLSPGVYRGPWHCRKGKRVLM